MNSHLRLVSVNPRSTLEFAGVLDGLGAIPEPTRPTVVAKPSARPKRPQGKQATPAALAAWQSANANWETQSAAYRQYQAELKHYNQLLAQYKRETNQENKAANAATRNAERKAAADAKRANQAATQAAKKEAAAANRADKLSTQAANRADKLAAQQSKQDHAIAMALAKQGINPYETAASADMIDPNTGFLKSHLIDWSANYDALTPYASDFYMPFDSYGMSTFNPSYNDPYTGYAPATQGDVYESNFYLQDNYDDYGDYPMQLPQMYAQNDGGLRPDIMSDENFAYADDYYNSIYGGWDDGDGWDSGGLFDVLGAVPSRRPAPQPVKKSPINTEGVETMVLLGGLALAAMYMLAPKGK